MRKIILLSLYTILLLALTPFHEAEAVTIQVRPGASLQQALSEAKDGDILQVTKGHYRGSLVIDKKVTLLGQDKPVLDGGQQGDVITILASGVTVRGFTITGSGQQLEQSEAGIKLKSVQGVTIADCQLKDNLFGIYLDRSQGNVLLNNTITGRQQSVPAKVAEETENNQFAGQHAGFAGESGDGIHLFASSDNKVEKNMITHTRDGIYFNYAQNNRLIANEITGVRYGIHYMYSDDNYFEKNLLTHNVSGAALMFSKRITLQDNVFAHSRGQRAYGILFATCDDSVAQGNIIVDNTRGVFFDTSLHNVFKGNLLDGNDVALDLISSSSDNLFVQNNFMDNLQQVAMAAGRAGDGNRFDAQGKGNYWQDYRGFDLDRDGVGDILHQTGDPFTYLMSKAPAVRLFLNSPASTALEFSERMFPVIDIPKVEDHHPLAAPLKIKVPTFAYHRQAVEGHWLGGVSLLMLLAAFIIYHRTYRLTSPQRSKKQNKMPGRERLC